MSKPLEAVVGSELGQHFRTVQVKLAAQKVLSRIVMGAQRMDMCRSLMMERMERVAMLYAAEATSLSDYAVAVKLAMELAGAKEIAKAKAGREIEKQKRKEQKAQMGSSSPKLKEMAARLENEAKTA